MTAAMHPPRKAIGPLLGVWLGVHAKKLDVRGLGGMHPCGNDGVPAPHDDLREKRNY